MANLRDEWEFSNAYLTPNGRLLGIRMDLALRPSFDRLILRQAQDEDNQLALTLSLSKDEGQCRLAYRTAKEKGRRKAAPM